MEKGAKSYRFAPHYPWRIDQGQSDVGWGWYQEGRDAGQ